MSTFFQGNCLPALVMQRAPHWPAQNGFCTGQHQQRFPRDKPAVRVKDPCYI